MKTVRTIRIEGDIAYIPLTQGYEAVIDAADVPLIEGYLWRAQIQPHAVYATSQTRRAGENRTCLRLHRVIMAAPNGLEVDHINSDGLDNRRSNLRLATKAQNQQNARKRCDNASGVKGVYWYRASNKWRAQISLDGRNRSLGYFGSIEEAYEAYVEAARRLHGEFARVME